MKIILAFAVSMLMPLMAQQTVNPSGPCAVSSTFIIVEGQTGQFVCRPTSPGAASGTWAYVPVAKDAAVAFYPNGLPAASNGTPTINDATAFVNYIASSLAQRVLDYTVMGKYAQRFTSTGATHSGTTSANGQTVTTTNFTSITEALPLDVMNANNNLRDAFSDRVAMQMAKQIDARIAALYTALTTRSIIGLPGTPLSAANIDSMVSATPASFGEQIFLAVADETHLAAGIARNSINTGYYKGVKILVCDQMVTTGASPPNMHNIGFTPSVFGLVTNLATPTNSATVAQAVSSFGGINLLIAITNSGSGNQTVTVSMLGGAFVLTGGAARGTQMES